MEWLSLILAPVSFLTSFLFNPWLAACLLGVITTLGVAFRHFKPGITSNAGQSSRQKSPGVSVTINQQEVVKSVLQVFPVHTSNGWTLSGVSNSVRVFSHVWDAHPPQPAPHTTHQQSAYHKALASSIVLECPPNKALARATSCTDLPLWTENVALPGPQVLRTASERDGDLIRLTFTKEVATPPGEIPTRGGVVSFLLEAAGSVIGRFAGNSGERLDQHRVEMSVETLSRSWYSKPGLHYLHSFPKDPSSLPYHWNLLIFTGIRESNKICLATLVVLPRQQCSSHVTSLITSQLCALKEHIVMKNLKVYPSLNRNQATRQPQSAAPPTNQTEIQTRRSSAHPRYSGDAHDEHGKNLSRQNRNKSEPVLSPYTGPLSSDESALSLIREIPPTTQLETISGPVDSRDVQYLEMAMEKANKLLSAAEATEREGWAVVGTKQNVHIMKLVPQGGKSPMNCVKGTGPINVPPTFILRFLKDSTYITQLDDMLKEARKIHVISGAVQLVQMLYKGVWPTSPRDFAVLSISGQLDPGTWISAGVSIEDTRIPQEKGHVRGHLEAGGYVIRAVPGKPDVSEVTYVAQVDLKGSIPSMVVNKIADSQPQCVNRLRNIVEPLYRQLSQNPQTLREYEEKFVIANLVPEPPTTIPPTQLLSPLDSGPQLQVERDDFTDSVEPSHTPSPLSPDVSSVTTPQTVSSTSSRVKGHVDVSGGVKQRSSLVSNSNSSKRGPTDFAQETHPSVDGQVLNGGVHENGFQTPTHLSEDEDGYEGRGTRGSASSAVPVPKVMVSGDDLQFQAPRLSDVVLHPSLMEDHSTPSSGDSAALNMDESLEAYTPEEFPSDNETSDGGDGGEGGDAGGGSEAREGVFVNSPSPQLELKLPVYQRSISSSEDGTESEVSESRQDWRFNSLTMETMSYPRQGTGGLDFRTMANQTAARVLEEVFHVEGIDLSDPMTFGDQTGGWRFSGYEKDVLMLTKKSPDSPFNSFIGKGIIDLSPQTVYDSIRNPQLRFTYDNMLKALHIVKQIEEGLYILHLHHETTQCFVKQARDFCLLVSERSEPDKKLLTGTSIEVPECPPKSDIHRGKVLCSGWVIEPYRSQGGKLQTQATYLLQVDMGGVPSTLVNFISRRQPLAVAYLREYLISTSLDLSHREDRDSTL